MSSAPVRVGIDLCSVREVAESIERFGDRYLRRVYTEHELEYCGQDPARSAERFAARFAAKEATVKVLRPRDSWPDWRSIEVRRDPGGWCELSLTGTAARLARDADIGSLALSLSHDGGMANAVVVATLSETARPYSGGAHNDHGPSSRGRRRARTLGRRRRDPLRRRRPLSRRADLARERQLDARARRRASTSSSPSDCCAGKRSSRSRRSAMPSSELTLEANV